MSQTKENQKQPEYAITKATSYIGAKKSILVVDDDPNQHRLMQDLLQPLGFTVLLTSNATAGFTVLENNSIDLMLLDVRMPEVDGWQMAKQIRKQKYTLPIIMVSANARDIDVNLQANDFHNGYIAKPVNIDSLLGKIAQCLHIEWQYKNIKDEEKQIDKTSTSEYNSKVNAEHYQTLIAIAEIGYLSGFKEQMKKIDNEFSLPNNVKSQLNEYVAQCNFPKIIQYLNELINKKMIRSNP